MRVRFFLFVAALVLALISCSGNDPVIEEIQWRVLYRDTGTHQFEELALFFRVSDPDDAKDPNLLTLQAGDTGLIWRFSREAWIEGPKGNAQWWGLPGIIPQEGFRLPDVLYTVSVEDLAGRKDEQTFRLDPDRLQVEEMVWPTATLAGDRLILDAPENRVFVILRDGALNRIKTLEAANNTKLPLSGAVYWEVWIDRPIKSGGFRLGPYPVSSSGEISSKNPS